MGSINNSIIAEMAEELSIEADSLSGAPDWDLIGTLEENPVQIIFDNQTDVSVAIGNDNDTVWKTFEAGEALVLDMRGNHGVADNFTFRKNMPLYAQGTAGTAGLFFRISYTYANSLTG